MGSRDVVDALLNRPMIESITSPFGTMLTLGLCALAVLQLVTMTYVAVQKGWDGVALPALVVVAWTFDYFVYSDHRVAALWLCREGVAIQARSFRFSGRTVMIGAIQVLKGNGFTAWMDGILAPSRRRTVWLAKLNDQVEALENELSQVDKVWVSLNTALTKQAVETIGQLTGPVVQTGV